ncbi:MAG: CARDB domain-containing protein [Bacteroidia bacterium]
MKKTLLFLFTFITFLSFAQTVPPYFQRFDSVNCTGWTHYAISGTDNWERGVPVGYSLNDALTPPNVWGTKLNGVTSAYSVMALETPDFDLSDLTKIFLLNFVHEYETYSYQGGNIEYSTDLGASWTLLNGAAADKQNWYSNPSCSALSGQPAWSYSYHASFMFSSHSLAFLQGYPAVRFRFKYGVTSNPQEGWVIDNFSITENIPNVQATTGQTFNATKHFLTFDVVTSLSYMGLLPPPFSNTTNYYFSRDNVLDAGDSLLGNRVQTVYGSVSNWSKTFSMIPNLNAGDYYIFYTHDFANTLSELDETDNTSYCILHIDSTFNIPEYKENFEDTIDYWKKDIHSDFLVKGYSNIHQIENPHGGSTSWYIKDPDDYGSSSSFATGPQYLEGPYMDMTPAPNNVMCFWYKMKRQTLTSADTKIEFSTVNAAASYSTSVMLPVTRANGWDCHCEDLSFMNGKNNTRIRFNYSGSVLYGMGIQNVNIDDIYIGQRKPDLSIENKNAITTPQSFPTDTLTYTLFNSGLSAAAGSTTEFYWSADSILDAGDALLATVSESPLNDTLFRKEKVVYTKPTTAAGNYYIIYVLDAGSSLAEMREENNVGFFRVSQVPVMAVPYTNDFESQITGWSHSSSIGADEWTWGIASGTYFTSPFALTKSFHTTAGGSLAPMSRQHLYTPVFDLSSLPDPVLEFDMHLNGPQSCQCFQAAMNMSYTVDGGATWIVLDTLNNSYDRWYYPMEWDYYGGRDRLYAAPNTSLLFFSGTERAFAMDNDYNSRGADVNTHYLIDMAFLAGHKNVQFRFNLGNQKIFSSVGWSHPSEGAVVDNFSIRDKFIDLKVNYKKALMYSSRNTNVKFAMDVKNAGNYIAAATAVKFYLSADTLIDASDYFLGEDTTKVIRPDMKANLSEVFVNTDTLSGYSYLLYDIDPYNVNAESDEVNNRGYWPLALDSIRTYPYVQDFNDPVAHGWAGYTVDAFSVKDRWRVRTSVAPGQALYQTGTYQGELYTDMINPTLYSAWGPTWYVETPAFDFSSCDSVSIAFDMLCDGRSGMDGGNFWYSTDGGNSFTLLNNNLGASINWYSPWETMSDLGGESGWFHVYGYTPTFYDISFLKGYRDVVFRYKFKSTAATFGPDFPQGLHLDNFRVNGKTEDYVANDSMTLVNVTATGTPTVNINYSISNLGSGDGKSSVTKFYWSADSTFGAGDSLLTTVSQSAIDSMATFNGIVSITYPSDLTNTNYYIFYTADADTVIRELSETNNTGSLKLDFGMYTNYAAGTIFDTVHVLSTAPSFNLNYTISNFGTATGLASRTEFFWSADNVFTLSDPAIQMISQPGIAPGTISNPNTVFYPTPVSQPIYYLFYRADDTDTITELDESDNLGSFVVVFDDLSAVEDLQQDELAGFVSDHQLHILAGSKENGKRYRIHLESMLGENITDSEIILNEGANTYALPRDISSGLYIVTLENDKRRMYWKVVVP